MGLSPDRLLVQRTKQKTRLARYARISPFEWWDREVSELNAYDTELCEMIERENAVSRGSENR